ncbi:MAG: hypothetical protein ACRCUJ_14945 [Phocaeicola sp.]
MELQEIIVFAILFLCIGFIGIRIYHSFNKINQGESPCSSCDSECALKHQSMQNRAKKKKTGNCK